MLSVCPRLGSGFTLIDVTILKMASLSGEFDNFCVTCYIFSILLTLIDIELLMITLICVSCYIINYILTVIDISMFNGYITFRIKLRYILLTVIDKGMIIGYIGLYSVTFNTLSAIRL